MSKLTIVMKLLQTLCTLAPVLTTELRVRLGLSHCPVSMETRESSYRSNSICTVFADIQDRGIVSSNSSTWLHSSRSPRGDSSSHSSDVVVVVAAVAAVVAVVVVVVVVVEIVLVVVVILLIVVVGALVVVVVPVALVTGIVVPVTVAAVIVVE